MTLLGIDVEAMFPSLTSEYTGWIVRKMFLESQMEIGGFNWKYACHYIKINSSLTDIKRVASFLPVTKSGRGIGMNNKGINAKVEDVDDQWIFPDIEPSKNDIREIAARVAEVGVRTIFENFTYKFAGTIYLQKGGGQ